MPKGFIRAKKWGGGGLETPDCGESGRRIIRGKAAPKGRLLGPLSPLELDILQSRGKRETGLKATF